MSGQKCEAKTGAVTPECRQDEFGIAALASFSGEPLPPLAVPLAPPIN